MTVNSSGNRVVRSHAPDDSMPDVVKKPLTWQNVDVLSTNPDGRAAIPYTMNHNALNKSLSMRIIIRLYLVSWCPLLTQLRHTCGERPSSYL
jgi:hypothetical protein